MATATVFTNAGKGAAAGRQMGATPSQAPLKYIGMGTGGGSRTAATSDTALTTPVESRVAGTESQVTTTNTNDTYQVVGTITASAARTINEAATFDASTAGTMGISATFADINLASADSIQFTMKVQFT